MNEKFFRSLFEKAVGEFVLKYVDAMKPEDVFPVMESRALETLYNIKAIMDDETLEDPECFRKIEAIVNVFEAYGIDTTRHDW